MTATHKSILPPHGIKIVRQDAASKTIVRFTQIMKTEDSVIKLNVVKTRVIKTRFFYEEAQTLGKQITQLVFRLYLAFQLVNLSIINHS